MLNSTKSYENAIFVENLNKKYDGTTVLKNISFLAKKGEVVGLLGPNGAGKTTTMNILTGCVSYDFGEVLICGINLFNKPLKAKKHIGYMPENPPLYNNMTVFEYLKFVCELKKVKQKKEEVKRLLELCSLKEKQNILISSLSKGFKQRVGLAQALVGSPMVLVLDEPTSGLDPVQIVNFRKIIKSLAKKHTIIFSSHILSEIQAVCERIIIIDSGKIVADDFEEKLLTDGNNSYFLELFCPLKDKILSVFKKFEEFLVLKSVKEQKRGFFEVEIKIKKNVEDFNLKVATQLMNEKIPILKFSRKNSSEDVFVNLTEKKI